MKLGIKITNLSAVIFIIVLMVMGVLLGNFHGYARGFHDGQSTTNSWWIDKQSRYYDSNEVEKKQVTQ